MNELLTMKQGTSAAMTMTNPLAMPLSSLERYVTDDDSSESSSDDEDDIDTSMSDVSSDYDTDEDDEDDDDDSSIEAASRNELEDQDILNQSRNSTGNMGGINGALNRGGAVTLQSLQKKKEAQQPEENSNPITRRASMPNMHFDFDMDTSQLTEEDNRSMSNLFQRMNSSRTLTYFQDADEPVAIPKELEISHHTKTSKRASQDEVVVADQQSPQSDLEEIILGLSGADLPDSFWDTYFVQVTEARKEAYTMDLVQAMRGQDLDRLRTLGVSMDACNAQGESLLHIACRRRNHALVQFLVEDAQVSVRVRDDYGKTPLHELCWNSKPGQQPFESVKLLLRMAPELLFCKDKRGFTPLQYVPKDSWKDWRRFLDRYEKMIRCKVQLIGFQRSRNKLRETLEKAESLVGRQMVDTQ